MQVTGYQDCWLFSGFSATKFLITKEIMLICMYIFLDFENDYKIKNLLVKAITTKMYER